MTIRISEKLEFLELPTEPGRANTGQIWFDENTQTFKLRENDGYSNYIQSKGNQSLLNILNTPTAILDAYVSSTGSDDLDGYGFLPTKPFKTIQRAFDEIPNGAVGTVIINLLGAGPFDEAKARDYESPTYLYVYVIGDRTTISESAVLSGTPSTVTNPTGGNKYAVKSFNIGAYGTVFTNGSHWVEFSSQDFIDQAFGGILPKLMDGTNSTTPSIRVVTTTNIFNEYGTQPVTVKIYPFTSVIENQRLDATYGQFEHFTWLKSVHSHSQKIVFVGCILAPNTFLNVTDVSLKACLCPTGLLADGVTYDLNVHVNSTTGEVALATTGTNQYYAVSNGGTLSGIFDGGLIDVFQPSGLIYDCIFRNIGSSGYQLTIGTHTEPSPGGATKIDYCDFEPRSSQKGILVRASSIRHGSFGGSSLNHRITNWLSLEQNSWARIEMPVDGYTTSTSIIVGAHSFIYGVGSLSSGSPRLRNITSSGQDIQIGVMTPISWSTVNSNSQTDLARLARAEA